MDIQLNASAKSWQQKTREFADKELIPWEVEAELNQGVLPPEVSQRMQELAVELGLSRMDAPKEHGGLALGMVEQMAIWEQLGRVTNALCWCFSEAQHWMYEACTQDQIDRYITPMAKGEKRECYAITEAESGSYETVDATATPCEGGYKLNGEKWFVTSANLAHFFFFQAKMPNGRDALFFVDIDEPGIEITENPLFSHTFPSHHPTYLFTDVFVPAANMIGDGDSGMDYSRAWFRHERMGIAARTCGAAQRLIEEATEFALNRKMGDETLADKQMIQTMLADSVTELWAARLMMYEAAEAHDRGDDLKALHVRCATAKLYCSEMANRVADRCLQIFGGRGYRRDNAVERFYRELRVDRIWEGASEVQRLVIARALYKRGLMEM